MSEPTTVDHPTHIGHATYAAYTQGCREIECVAAATEYRARLKERKERGQFIDQRMREHRMRWAMEKIAEDVDLSGEMLAILGPVEGEPVPAAAGTEPAPDPPVDPQQVQAVSVDPGATTYRDKVLNYLNLSVIGRGTGKLNPSMLRIMPTVLGMQPDHCQAVLDELDEAGMLAGDGTDLYLVAA